MTKKTAFLEGWSWLNPNNLGLALDTSLKFYTSVQKVLKLKVITFWELIPTFVEVTAENLQGRVFLPPFHSSWIGLMSVLLQKDSQICLNYLFFTWENYLRKIANICKATTVYCKLFIERNCNLIISKAFRVHTIL